MTNINPFKIIMKVRTAMWYLFFQAIGIWLLSSCEQKDLCYDHNHASNVKVTFDWEQYPNANPASMCFYLFPREEGERTLKGNSSEKRRHSPSPSWRKLHGIGIQFRC